MSGGVRQEVEAMALLRGMVEHFDVHGVPPEVSAYFREADRILHTRATPTPPIEGRDADVERVAREAWWSHHESRTRSVALADLDSGSLGTVTLEYADVEAMIRAALQALGERPHAD